MLKEFADQSTIHGLHYVSNVKRHWTERWVHTTYLIVSILNRVICHARSTLFRSITKLFKI